MSSLSQANSRERTEAFAETSSWLARLLVPPATVVVVIVAAVLLLMTPLYMHAAIDISGASANLGMSAEQAHHFSDLTINELIFGPGSFAFAAPDGTPFYNVAERGHMVDVRQVLWFFLIVAAIGAVVLGSFLVTDRGERSYRAIGRGGAILAVGTLVLGTFAALAFNLAFELFHQLLFPGGNYSFDATNRLVQLYPLTFWQLTAAAMGSLLVAAGAGLWFVARRTMPRGNAT